MRLKLTTIRRQGHEVVHMNDVRAVCDQGHPGAECLIAEDKQGIWRELAKAPTHLHREHDELVDVAKPLLEFCWKRQLVEERLGRPLLSEMITGMHALADHPREAGHAFRIQEIRVNELNNMHELFQRDCQHILGENFVLCSISSLCS